MEWISVKDKLPPITAICSFDIYRCSADVLCLLSITKKHKEMIVARYNDKYHDNYNFWDTSGYQGRDNYQYMKYITHWMPLPEKPTE